jgi:hypothetical protein
MIATLLHSASIAVLDVLMVKIRAHCALYGEPDRISLPEVVAKALASLQVPSTEKFAFGRATEKLAT